MQMIRIGGPYRFIPSAFTGEKTGMTFGGKEMPRQVCGTVTFIHQAHRFFSSDVQGQRLHPARKYQILILEVSP